MFNLANKCLIRRWYMKSQVKVLVTGLIIIPTNKVPLNLTKHFFPYNVMYWVLLVPYKSCHQSNIHMSSGSFAFTTYFFVKKPLKLKLLALFLWFFVSKLWSDKTQTTAVSLASTDPCWTKARSLSENNFIQKAY